jgi:predicted extracellular nuclease
VKRFLFISLLFLCGRICAQDETLLKPGRIIFYNVENLFDTVKDPVKHDEDFLPTAKSKWNTKKYQVKLEHISKVIAAMLDSVQPIVVGLSEVENRKVIEDLIAQPALQKFNFGIIHHESPDERGIDVALLYNKDVIEEVFDAFLRVEFSFDTADKTRDIIYFKGYMTEQFPIYFFVNHWTSRRTANGDSEKKRITEAMLLKAKIEDIYKGEPFARIVVMGDFNDNPDNKSVEYLCSGNYKYPLNQNLVNLMRLPQSRHEFTLKYHEQNDVFDQFIVSKNLLTSENPYYIRNSAAHIFKPLWIMYDSTKYGLIPSRTYLGDFWVGGYSDHLPVYMDICFH